MPVAQELQGNITRPTLAVEAEFGAAVAVEFPDTEKLSVTNSKHMTRAWEFECFIVPGGSNDNV
jgi:hypothetical protein